MLLRFLVEKIYSTLMSVRYRYEATARDITCSFVNFGGGLEDFVTS